MAVDSTSIYWTTTGASKTSGTIWKVSLAGASQTPQSLGTIDKVSRGGGAVTNLYSSVFDAPLGIAIGP